MNPHDEVAPRVSVTDVRTVRRRHVLIFMDTSTVSGPLRQLIASLQDLARDHAVTARLVVCTRKGRDVRAMRQFVAEAGIPVLHLEERSRLDWSVVRAYARLLVDAQVDCVQTHGYKPTILLAMLHWRRRRTPWIAFFHGRTYETRAIRFFDRLAIRCARLADRIVVVAGSQRALFSGTTSVRHIPNAVTLPPVSDRDTALSDPSRVVYVGRLSPEKGVDVLIRAIQRLRTVRPDVTLQVIGEGPERAAIETLITDHGLAGVVTLVGPVTDPGPHYVQARVLCLPSRSEGMPNVVLEAIAAGLPVVATAVGDVPSLVSPALGEVVPPDDPDALAAALDRELGTVRGSEFVEAQQDLLARHSRAHRARALRTLYDEVVGVAD